MALAYIGVMTVAKTIARRARFKLVSSILTTHGYAILGVAIVQPLLSGTPRFALPQIAGFIAGLTMQGFAIYIAPLGEPS
jgi:hypothetical protein